MSNPLVSVFASANRPQYWQQQYDQFQNHNDISFELVFVGDKCPTFDLPDNFKFIYSEVKPAQCYHIAVLECSGQYIINTSDDLSFTPHALDYFLEYFNKQSNENAIITSQHINRHGKIDSMRYRQTSEIEPKNVLLPEGPVLSVGSFIKRETYFRVEGVDKRFIGQFWDVDMTMSIYDMGGTVIICPKVTTRETAKNKLAKEQGWYDRQLFQKFWYQLTPDGKAWEIRRMDAVQPFENNETLRTISQGSKGRWS